MRGRTCPHRPGDSGVPVGIAAVEEIFVVEIDAVLHRRGDVGRPLENLLGPVHAHVVVHPSVANHLELAGVPEGVVGLGSFELTQGVEVLALVSCVFGDGLFRPVFGAGG